MSVFKLELIYAYLSYLYPVEITTVFTKTCMLRQIPFTLPLYKPKTRLFRNKTSLVRELGF